MRLGWLLRDTRHDTCSGRCPKPRFKPSMNTVRYIRRERPRSPPPPLQSRLHFTRGPTELKAWAISMWILAWFCMCCTNIYMTPAVATHPGGWSTSSCVDVFTFQAPSRAKILVVGQSVAAGMQPSAFHVCTWALLMQEDCLLLPGTTGSSPSGPKMASRVELVAGSEHG
jgi:hypothetical protein